MYLFRAAVGCIAAAALIALADEPPRAVELQPRPVTFRGAELPLQDVLKALEKQTGNTVDDRRSQRDNRKVKLPSGPSTFWRTLDTMGVGFSAYQPDGGVALVDAPYRKLHTNYSGLFRFTFKQITLSRDEETLAHHCRVTLDAAWEPRFQALYLKLEKASVTFGKVSDNLERQAEIKLTGTCATEFELRMKAPTRAVQNLDTLKGELRVIGAPKMLEFTYPAFAAGNKDKQEGVNVTLTDVNKSSLRWSVDVLIENPPGAITPLESYQSWLDNNRIWLAWAGQKLEPVGEQQQDTAKGVKIRYQFTAKDKTPLPPAGAAVTLHYRTPNRVVAVAVPFEFAALPLP